MTALPCYRVARAGLGEAVKRLGHELLYQCPNHDDQRPSLKINDEKNVWMCGPCGTGGNPWQLAAFIAGLSADDKPGVRRWLRERGLIDGNDRGGGERRIVATYDYRDESGKLLFQTVRYQPKNFRQRRPDGGGGWVWSLDGVRLVPYRLPEWKDKPVVYLVEGEKDADALWRLSLPATCNPMGAGKWRAEYNSLFQGKQVVILVDNDEAGERHALDVARHLLRSGAAAVKIVRLPGLPPKGDVSDWLTAGGAREQLTELVRGAPVVTAAEVADVTEQEASEPVGVLASEIKPEPVRWLWTNRIPLGKVAVIDGDPGLGKSMLALEIAARVSRGEPLPGDEAGLSGGAVILSAEDGPADTIRPRLEAAGADLDRVLIVKYAPDKEGERTVSQVPGDIPTMEAAIKRVGAKLVVIDVLMAYLGSDTNSHRDQDIRRALAPLAALADRAHVAVLVIRHLNKTVGGNPLYRGGGSIGVIGAARAGMLVAPDPEDADVRLLAMTKSNLGRLAPTLAYRIEERAGVPYIVWQGESHHTVATLLATVGGEEGGALADARDFLLGELNAGPKAARDINPAAKEVGITKATLRRASKSLRVIASKDGFQGQWLWSLPSKALKDAKGAHVEKMSTFEQNGAKGESKSRENSDTYPKVLKGAQEEDRQEQLSPFGMDVPAAADGGFVEETL
jgi:hypothetical protein